MSAIIEPFTAYVTLYNNWQDCPLDVIDSCIMPMLWLKSEIDESLNYAPLVDYVAFEWGNCPIEVIEECVMPFVCQKKYICLAVDEQYKPEIDIDSYERKVTCNSYLEYTSIVHRKNFDLVMPIMGIFNYVKIRLSNGSGFMLYGVPVMEYELPDGTEVIVMSHLGSRQIIYFITTEGMYSHYLGDLAQVTAITDTVIHFSSGTALRITDRSRIRIGFLDISSVSD